MNIPEIELARHRLTVDEYYRMAELGILAPDARVELIEGEIIDMPPQGSRHAAIVSRLNARIVTATGSAAIVRCQMPIRLGARSEPEPDFAIVKPDELHYARAHPVADEVLLLIEISHNTINYDRHVKIPLYARHAILEAWVIDVEARRLHLCRNPRAGSYRDVSVLDRPANLCPVSLPSLAIDLSGII